MVLTGGAYPQRAILRSAAGVTSPCQTVSMEPTNMAPTMTTAMRPAAVSNQQMIRSFRANSPGMVRAVAGLTLNRVPGTYTISLSTPPKGMWTR